jgi:hypothetical protein
MYKQVFIPTEQHHHISIPSEWYGKMWVEVRAVPIFQDKEALQAQAQKQEDAVILPVQEMYAQYLDSLPQVEQMVAATRRKQRQEVLGKHLIDLSNFHFNRDEANYFEF